MNATPGTANGRAIFGGLVPWGEVWRTGADEATKLTTEADMVIGGLKVPKGEYALFTIPTEKQWTLVLNKTANQWGAFKYDATQDLGRAPMTVGGAAKPVEQFTIEMVPAGKQLTLKLSWDKTVASVAVAHELRDVGVGGLVELLGHYQADEGLERPAVFAGCAVFGNPTSRTTSRTKMRPITAAWEACGMLRDVFSVPSSAREDLPQTER